MKAAVLYEVEKPLVVDDVELLVGLSRLCLRCGEVAELGIGERGHGA